MKTTITVRLKAVATGEIHTTSLAVTGRKINQKDIDKLNTRVSNLYSNYGMLDVHANIITKIEDRERTLFKDERQSANYMQTINTITNSIMAADYEYNMLH